MSAPNDLKPQTSLLADHPAPVRVELKRINANLSHPYPPDGEGRQWWERLKVALGTCSSDFVKVSLFQLQSAARLPCSGISAVGVNAALAIIEGAKPKNELEAALVLQMACTHAANMAILSLLGGGSGGSRHAIALANASARLSQAFATQFAALNRHRNGRSQFVRVEHVHVNDGGQAVIGNIAPARLGAEPG